jgi:hypothetical protein
MDGISYAAFPKDGFWVIRRVGDVLHQIAQYVKLGNMTAFCPIDVRSGKSTSNPGNATDPSLKVPKRTLFRFSALGPAKSHYFPTEALLGYFLSQVNNTKKHFFF